MDQDNNDNDNDNDNDNEHNKNGQPLEHQGRDSQEDDDDTEYCFAISVQTRYLEEDSSPNAERFVFAYTIGIQNQGRAAAQLISRRWVIADSNGKIEEVRGLGVVGQQPYLAPNQRFEYTSWAVIATPQGSMHGSYFFVGDDDFRFEASIPEFGLIKPNSLH